MPVLNQIATRKAYGMALAKLGRYNEHVVAMDGDTKNSTFSELFKNEHPNRYVECYIAEQNMVRNTGDDLHCSQPDNTRVKTEMFQNKSAQLLFII